MSSFTAQLLLRKTNRKDKWKYPIYETTRQFTYHVGDRYSDEWITVPEGTSTNLASIPPGLRWYFPELTTLSGKFIQCTVLHDYMVSEFSLTLNYTRKQAREIFDESLQVMRYPTCKRLMVIFGVALWDIYRVGFRAF